MNDEDVIAEIDRAFGRCAKPEHFTNYTHCEECAEHDQLLRDRNRETLSLEDVGNLCWQPISFCSGEGMAYYFPSLARLAMAPPTRDYDWYGDVLLIHLNSSGHPFLSFCNAEQRRSVCQLLHRLQARISGDKKCLSWEEDFVEALALWGEP